jgi:hypothetical protein
MAQPEIVSRGEIVACLGLGDSLSEADAGLLELLKGMVENEARRYCGHDITQPAAPYVHFLPEVQRTAPQDALLAMDPGGLQGASHSGQMEVLQLPRILVRTAGLEVREDPDAAAGQAGGDFGDDTLLTPGSDYYLDVDQAGLSRSGHLIRIAGPWPSRPRTVRVTYVAGLTAGELDNEYSDIKLAIIEEVAQRFRLAKSRQGSDGGGTGAVQSESIGGEYSVTYDTRVLGQGSLSSEIRERLAPYVSLAP